MTQIFEVLKKMNKARIYLKPEAPVLEPSYFVSTGGVNE